MEKLARFVLGFILVVVAIIFSGFVLTKLWEWFVVYAFDLPSISIPVAMGLILVLSKATGGISSKNNDDIDQMSISDIGQWFFQSIIMQGFILLFGWIITWFL